MGFPITFEVMHGGLDQSFPIYVWLIDSSGGPIWQEMDQNFSRWDKSTGPHLAFFVDPFMRDSWARGFLARIFGQQTVSALMASKTLAQQYFRDRLAEHACRELWISPDRLPLAVIATSWDARKLLLCHLPTRTAVANFLEVMTELGRRYSQARREPSREELTHLPRRRFQQSLQMREIEQSVEDLHLEWRSMSIARNPLAALGRKEAIEDRPGPALNWFQERGGLPGPGGEPNLASSATRASFTSLDDLIHLAYTLASEKDRLPLDRRPPPDQEVRTLSKFNELLQTLHSLRQEISNLASPSGRPDQILLDLGAERLGAFSHASLAKDVDMRLEKLMGRETYERLQDKSKAALRSSEVVNTLSEAIHELHEDLAAVLVGFWKASEIEGRRLVVDLLARCGGIPAWHDDSKTVKMIRDPEEINRDYTAGGLGWLLQNTRFGPDAPWCALPLPQLGERYSQMANRARNRFIHRDNLSDPADVTFSRQLVASPPDGILPTVLRCLDSMEAEDRIPRPLRPEEEARLTELLKDVSHNNASAFVLRHLASLKGRMRHHYAKRAQEELGSDWLNDPKRIGQSWVSELRQALSEEIYRNE